MNKDGSMNANSGARYNSLDRFDARTKLWEDMEAEGLTIKVFFFNYISFIINIYLAHYISLH